MTGSIVRGLTILGGAAGGGFTVQEAVSTAPASTDRLVLNTLEWRRRKAEGTIGQRRIGRTGDGDPS
ncbi:hypothetical protein ACTI_03710 [Actinoplanes sp. OR16]|nr:hypothetical protein ACTI_03710 [Actinoplanes sp. OR16]